jgi:hypothetical protein
MGAEYESCQMPLAVTDWLRKELTDAAEAAPAIRSAADLGVEPLNGLLRTTLANSPLAP